MAELFQKLKCSKCKKYLSVLPIRVYYNRLVTCGRCNSENDGGTISTLYEAIAQNIEFPCANRYAGCREHQLPKDMILHENTCKSSLISCPLCDFEGYSLVLVDHVKQAHSNFFLDIPVFYISFNDSNKEEVYVYASESNYTLVIISIRYDSIVNRLHLYFNLICLEDECEKALKFNLYSMDNNLVYKSLENKFVSNSVGSSCCSYEICTDSYSVNKAICRFFIEGDIKIDFRVNSRDSLPELPIEKEINSSNLLSDASSEKLLAYSKKIPNPIIIESPTPYESINFSESIKTVLPSTKIIKFVCKNVRSLKEPRFSPSFFVSYTCWNIGIKTYDSSGTPYLSLFLYKLKDSNENKNPYEAKNSNGNENSYKVDFEFTLLSLQEKNNIVRSGNNNTFKTDIGRGWTRLISFHDLLDPKNEYMNLLEDDFQLVLRLTLEEAIEYQSKASSK